MLRPLARLAAAALVAAAAVVVPGSPATAAFCSGGAGVSTVVDPGALGGGVDQECGPGPSAADAFSDDHTLAEHPRQPGFICRIDGAPGNGDCLRNDAYWALFVSDDGGPWVYASAGAYGQSVDDGDAVAFVWQSTGARRSPGVRPPAAPSATPTPTPTKQPSAKPTRKPTRTPSAQPTSAPSDASTAPTAAPSATPSADPSSSAPAGTPSPTGSASATESAGASSSGSPTTPTTPTSATSTPSSDEVDTPVSPAADQSAADDGVPLWLVLVMLLLVLGATLAVLVHRRRAARSPGP